MKSLDNETNETLAFEQPAELVIETVSMVTRAIRREMRQHRPVEMSMQQFRTLRIVQKHPDVSLTTVADHLGLTNASASKLVETLVQQQLVTRIDSSEDRRKVVLNLTEAGQRALEEARIATLESIAEVLAALGEPDRAVVIQAMGVLRRALSDVKSNKTNE